MNGKSKCAKRREGTKEEAKTLVCTLIHFNLPFVAPRAAGVGDGPVMHHGLEKN
jgi:hypothetical protein